MDWPMRLRLLTVLSVVSFLLCLASVALALAPDAEIALRDGAGGVWGGSERATYVLFSRRGWVGLGWTRSDIWFEGTVDAPAVLIATLAAILPVVWAGTPIRRGRRVSAG